MMRDAVHEMDRLPPEQRERLERVMRRIEAEAVAWADAHVIGSGWLDARMVRVYGPCARSEGMGV